MFGKIELYPQWLNPHINKENYLCCLLKMYSNYTSSDTFNLTNNYFVIENIIYKIII